MKSRHLVWIAVLVVLACVLVSAAPGTANKAKTDLAAQSRTVGYYKTVPDRLNYQGFLVENVGDSVVPVDATLEITFSLFTSESKGTAEWSETHSAVEVNYGLFHVLLGSVTQFPEGLFDGSALWLETQVGGETLAPRKPLVSTAYSHRANSAEMLLDYTLTDLDDLWVNEDQPNSVTSDMVTNGELVDADISVTADIHPGKINGTAWTAETDGAGSGLDADLLDGMDASAFVDSAHDHDDRYYTKGELNTSDGDDPNIGSNRVHWNNLVGMPEGLSLIHI